MRYINEFLVGLGITENTTKLLISTKLIVELDGICGFNLKARYYFL